MLLAPSLTSGESLHCMPCGVKMGQGRPAEKTEKPKGIVISISVTIYVQFAKYYSSKVSENSSSSERSLWPTSFYYISKRRSWLKCQSIFRFKLIVAGAQGEWCGPVQPSDAVYNRRSTNLFLRLQDEPIPEDSNDDEENVQLPLIQAVGMPDDTPLYSMDSPYLHFFVSELPSLMSIDHLFPNAMSRILGMTIGNPVLWHSVLALSSFLADKVVGRPTARTYLHLQRSLPLIQSAIQNGTINDSHIVAVFLLAYYNLATGEVASAGRHLDGLILLLEQRGATDDPLINAIRRLSIRLDNARGATDRSLAYSPHNLQTSVPHREWLIKLVDPSKPQIIDWALAEFELEDLANQFLHLNGRARKLRASPTHNPDTDEHELLFRAEILLNELQRWKLRPIFMAAEADENLSRLASLGQEVGPTFLHYPPLPFKNVLYASLMIQYYRLQILGSLIIRPLLGPEPPQRLEAAVNLCRTFASYKSLRVKIPSSMVIPMALAGFVLGGMTHSQGNLPVVSC